MFRFFFSEKIKPEVVSAYKWKVPDQVDVAIQSSKDGGYFIVVKNLPGCITQAETGRDIFEMVNDALYTYLEIPKNYRLYMPTFFPPEEIRKEFGIEIPKKFLERNLVLQRT